MPVCKACGGGVDSVALGLNYKIVSREAVDFLCLHCLAETFRTTEAALLVAAERFHRAGCRFFPDPIVLPGEASTDDGVSSDSERPAERLSGLRQ